MARGYGDSDFGLRQTNKYGGIIPENSILTPYCDVHYDIHVKVMFGSSVLPFVIQQGSYYYFYFFWYILTYTGVQHDFPYQMMFVSFNSNTTG